MVLAPAIKCVLGWGFRAGLHNAVTYFDLRLNKNNKNKNKKSKKAIFLGLLEQSSQSKIYRQCSFSIFVRLGTTGKEKY